MAKRKCRVIVELLGRRIIEEEVEVDASKQGNLPRIRAHAQQMMDAMGWIAINPTLDWLDGSGGGWRFVTVDGNSGQIAYSCEPEQQA